MSPTPITLTRFMIEERRADRVEADRRIEVVARAPMTAAFSMQLAPDARTGAPA